MEYEPMLRSSLQNEMVMEAATSSKGRMVSHEMA